MSLGGFCLGEKTSRLKCFTYKDKILPGHKIKDCFLTKLPLELYVHKLSVFHFCNDCAHI